MKQTLCFWAGMLLAGFYTSAQLPYTQILYQDTVIKDVVYGVDVNFAGKPETLKLDLYKPLGNPYCNRPMMIMIHGGAWIGGDKTDPEAVIMSHEYARRGYVVACINYRLGDHKRNYYEPYALCSTIAPNQPALYVADSSEVIRATYRAMQDAKAAMRFMKSRHLQDSTDYKTAFYGGQSAGAFTAFLAAFMNTPDEKPADCYALPNAPAPDPDLAVWLPAGYSLARPDLGPVEGTQNTDAGFDARAIGVLDFFGGIINTDILNGTDTPAVYIFHQTGDLVVDCGTLPLILPLYAYCINPINLCQPLDHYPIAAGGCSLKNIFENRGYLPDKLRVEIVSTTTYNCLADPPQHAIDNTTLRAANSSAFFAPIIAANGNTPQTNCTSAVANTEGRNGLKISPNPAVGQIFIQAEPGFSIEQYRIFDAGGTLIRSGKGNDDHEMTIPTGSLPQGFYILNVEGETGSAIGNFLKID